MDAFLAPVQSRSPSRSLTSIVPPIRVNLEDYILDRREQDFLAIRALHDINVIGSGGQYVGYMPQVLALFGDNREARELGGNNTRLRPDGATSFATTPTWALRQYSAASRSSIPSTWSKPWPLKSRVWRTLEAKTLLAEVNLFCLQELRAVRVEQIHAHLAAQDLVPPRRDRPPDSSAHRLVARAMNPVLGFLATGPLVYHLISIYENKATASKRTSPAIYLPIPG